MKVDEGFDCSWLMIDDDVSVDKMKASRLGAVENAEMTRREEKIYILVIYRTRLLRLTSFFERIFIKMREYLQTHAGLKI